MSFLGRYLVTQKDAANMRESSKYYLKYAHTVLKKIHNSKPFSTGLENWRDLVYQNVRDFPELHPQLVR